MDANELSRMPLNADKYITKAVITKFWWYCGKKIVAWEGVGGVIRHSTPLMV